MPDYRIIADDLTDETVVALLRSHLEQMHQWSPPESCHVMPVERLRAPDVAFYSAWDGEFLASVGAIRHLDPLRGELKSMRAAPEYMGQGAGHAMLEHLIHVARGRGYRWLGLETGTPEPFEPAYRLYTRAGFVEVAPFDDYVKDPWSRFMALELA